MNCSWWAAKWRQGILVLVAVATAASPVRGQTDAPSEVPPQVPVESQLRITSEPQGVIVELHGQYDWIGTTPWSLYRPLTGVYRVEAHHPGYGSWSRDVVLGPGGTRDLHIKLSRKSTFMAGVRSALIPGWGQRYNDKKNRGNVFLLAGTGAAIGMYVMNLRYDDKVDDYDVAEKAYLESRQIDQIPVLRRVLESEARRADDAWDDYKVAETIAISIYVAGIVDALFNGPDPTPTYSPGSANLDSDRSAETGPALGWNASLSPGGSTHLGLRFQF